MEKSMDIG